MTAADVTTKTCSCCSAQALWETLSLYGGRCPRCYAEYLRDRTPNSTGPAMTREERQGLVQHLKAMLQRMSAAPSKDWALKLKAREEKGEKLSQAQREAWRTALNARAHFGDDDEGDHL